MVLTGCFKVPAAVTRENLLEIVKRQMNTKHVRSPTTLRNPFKDFPEKERTFWRRLHESQVKKKIPMGYGFRPGEIGFGQFDSVEVIQVGGRRSNKMRVLLSESIWLPRTVLWAQALEGMTHLLVEE